MERTVCEKKKRLKKENKEKDVRGEMRERTEETDGRESGRIEEKKMR